MRKKHNFKYYNNLIDQIENIRKKNNVKWMDLCRLAITLDPYKASKIFSEINKFDSKINVLVNL